MQLFEPILHDIFYFEADMAKVHIKPYWTKLMRRDTFWAIFWTRHLYNFIGVRTASDLTLLEVSMFVSFRMEAFDMLKNMLGYFELHKEKNKNIADLVWALKLEDINIATPIEAAKLIRCLHDGGTGRMSTKEDSTVTISVASFEDRGFPDSSWMVYPPINTEYDAKSSA